MKTLISPLALIVLTMCSCKTAEPQVAQTVERVPDFTVTPFGERWRASRIEKKKGDMLNGELTREGFREVTIAQGSGQAGFNAIRIFADGTGYVVFTQDGKKNDKVGITLSEAEMASLIEALNADEVTGIARRYAAEVWDGVQGFIEIRTNQGRWHCWLDNHFDPVANSFAYCNRVIWPKIGEAGATVEETGIDRQMEYYRVFQLERKLRRREKE